MGLGSLVQAMSGHGGGYGHGFGRHGMGGGLGHLLSDASHSFTPGFMRNSTSNLTFFGNDGIGEFFHGIGRFLFGAKHQVNSVVHFSGTPSPGFNLGEHFRGAAAEEASRLGSHLVSEGARFGGYNFNAGPFHVFGHANPISHLPIGNLINGLGNIFR